MKGNNEQATCFRFDDNGKRVTGSYMRRGNIIECLREDSICYEFYAV